jgi:dTMP kinase
VSGLFISLEGPDGAGKGTMLTHLMPILKKHTSRTVVLTREPGGSPIAEKIRHLILDVANQEMTDETEALLYAAARSQHLHDIILPALAKDQIVISDRYVDSSIAYQGGGRQLGTDTVASINHFATGGVLPQLTLYVDISPEVGLSRIKKYRDTPEDRLEVAGNAFHDRVRATYLQLVHDDPQRIVALDGAAPAKELTAAAWHEIHSRFPQFFPA